MKNKFLIIGLLVLLLINAGCSNISRDTKNLNKGDSSMVRAKVLAGSTTPYIEFTQEAYDKALKENKTIVLYFYANWCPECKIEQKETITAFNELKLDNVIGFRVNYKDSDTDDNEVNLAKENGISYQHTKVIIKNSKQVLKAPDRWNKERYINEITKYA